MTRQFQLFLFALSILAPISFTAAQGTSVEWMLNSKEIGVQSISDAYLDKSSCTYLTGVKQIIDTNKINLAFKESSLVSYIKKLDSSGIELWAQNVLSDKFCHINSLTVNQSEETIILYGSFRGTIEFNGRKLSHSKSIRSFELMLTKNGNFKRFIEYPKYSFVQGTFAQGDSTVIAAELRSFKPNDNNKKLYRIYFLDETGLVFDSCGLESRFFELNFIKTAPNQNIILGGAFKDKVTVNNQLFSSKGMRDGIVLELDPSKIQSDNISAFLFGGDYDDEIVDIAFTKDGFIAIGSFQDEISFGGKAIISNGMNDVFIAGVDSSYRLKWINSFGGIANDYPKTMDYDPGRDRLIIGGSFIGKIDIDDWQIESQNLSTDAFLAKLDGKGILEQIEPIGDSNSNFIRHAMIYDEQTIFVNGNFSNSIRIFDNQSDFAPGENYYASRLLDCSMYKDLLSQNELYSLCGEPIKIKVDSSFSRYLWNGVQGSNSYIADSTQMITIKVVSTRGCEALDTVMAIVEPLRKPKLGGDIELYRDEIAQVEVLGGFKTYIWSSGEETKNISIEANSLTPGIHKLSVFTTDYNNCESTDEILINVHDRSKTELRINAYPNPVEDWLNIEVAKNTEHKQPIVIEIYSTLGQIIYSEKAVTDGFIFRRQLRLTNLNTGLYTLKINIDEQTHIIKIVKK